ncbi:MAG: hypothetical protein V2B18_03395 [Pseudomonadota bacterium]
MMPFPVVAGYVIAALAVPFVLHFHLLSAVFSGMAVHVLTVRLARGLPGKWGGFAHKLALGAIVLCVAAGLFGTGLGILSFLRGSRGMAALLTAVADTFENLQRTLPPDLADSIPTSLGDLREPITAMLRDHAVKISAAGMAGFKTFAHVVLGMVVGGMTAIHHFDPPDGRSPLGTSLHSRMQAIITAFEKVVFAQVKIAALNTALTACYLLIVLPLFGIRLPMLSVLVPLTFVTGLLPVVGNVVSNTAIVLISLGTSPGTAVASTVFLVAIHKLEYFTNARIVGGEVQATAWELLCAMLAMEAVFGISGLIAAPVVYACLKAELKDLHLI